MQNINLGNILFLDIETVSGYPDYDALPENFQPLWAAKARSALRKYDEPLTEDEISGAYMDRAGIFAEFGKIICISVGIVHRDRSTNKLCLRLKSFASDDEQQLLREFSELVRQHYNNPTRSGFCGHNIKEFDIPYICRRMIVQQLPLPASLQIAGKKPWDLQHLIDTMELWKFGDYKHYTSLKLLAATLGFPSPKDDIDGSEVGRVYWQEQDLPRIARYCEKDVLATVQLYLRYQLKPLIETSDVLYVSGEEE